ncbi:unnamed protein product [Symbiodinium sp. CCMP2592]|nr:unnamed protein product [Symbiodinium sp. CCMP2592]
MIEAPVLLAAPRAPGENDRLAGAAGAAVCSRRTLGLPKWFLSEAQLPEFNCESPLRPLRPVRGLQGLLLEGISEERTIEVPSPFLETFARTCAAGGMEKELAEVGIKKEALAASAGALRFVELRFPTVLQARQRALILYFCTFNFETHMAVPLLVRHQLYDADTTYGILQLWDLYGLDWPRASKAGIFLLRALDVKPSEAVAVNGSKQRKAAEFRADWQSAEEDHRRAGLAQLHAERELQRLERLNKKKRNADVEEIMQQLSIVPQQELLDALQSGKLPSGVDSQLVEAWILGNRLNFSGRAVDKKQLAKHAATEKLAIRRLLAAREEQTARSLGSDRGADKEPREWEARLMDFYSRANAARVAEEAQCLAARRWQGDVRQISAQRPSLPPPSELASARSEPEPREPLEPGYSAEQAAEVCSQRRRLHVDIALQRSFRCRHLLARRTLAILSRRPQLKLTGAEQLLGSVRAPEPGSLYHVSDSVGVAVFALVWFSEPGLESCSPGNASNGCHLLHSKAASAGVWHPQRSKVLRCVQVLSAEETRADICT